MRRRRASAVTRADEAERQGQAVRALKGGRLIAGMPQSVHKVQNEGSPVEARPFGAAPTWGGRRQDRVTALFEQLDKTLMNWIDASECALVVHRAYLTAALDLGSQIFPRDDRGPFPLAL